MEGRQRRVTRRSTTKLAAHQADVIDGYLAEGGRSPSGGPFSEQLTFGRLSRPDDAGEGEMGVEAVFDRHAGLSQGIAQVRLQGDQAREIDIRDARPQDARAPDTRKRADALRGELKAWISPNDGGERVR